MEELLQEEIFDENDQIEKEAAERIALWVGKQWKRKSKHLKSMASVVLEARAASELTSLLATNENSQTRNKRRSLFESFVQGLGFNNDSP